MTITNDVVALVGTGCETFFYTCYTILFALSIYLIFHGPRRGTSFDRPILIISGLLYLSCSTHFVLHFSYTYQVLIVPVKGVKGLIDENNFLTGADFLISITNFIGELIFIYRCWLLWSRNYWVIILPSLISIASLVCFSVAVHLVIRMNQNSTMAPPSLRPLTIAAFSLPLGTNVARNIGGAQFPTRTGQAAINIIVESGMLYLAVQLVFVILFVIGHSVEGIVGMIAVKIYGIAPTLILIRIALGYSNIQKQSGPILSGPPSSVLRPASSTQVGVNTISFTEPGRRLQVPAKMPVSEIKSKASSRDPGSALSSVEDVASVAV